MILIRVSGYGRTAMTLCRLVGDMWKMKDATVDFALRTWPTGHPVGVETTSDVVGLMVAAVLAPVGYALWRLVRR